MIERTRIQYGNETIAYIVQRARSRKTLSIEVHPDGSVLVRAPGDCSAAVISERVRRRASWISRQIEEFARYQPRTPARQYLSGESHQYLGRQYRLKVASGCEGGVRLSRSEILVSVPAATRKLVKAQLDRWFRQRALQIFGDILEHARPRLRGTEPPRLAIRAMRSRWGSLSPAGCMTLNIRLVHAPRACIEYVIAHELCHAVRRRHDSHFFSLLEKVMPDWRQRKERLESALL